MNLRKLKKVRHGMVNRANWLAAENDTRMYFIRRVKPCKTYSPWCSDCNAVKFRRDTARFPYSIVEFNEYEDKQQKETT
jgi:hypothetical protein